jgi:aromatic ring-opening dioxygenase LigB subunit
MNEYRINIPDYFEDDLDWHYEQLLEVGKKTAERFFADFRRKMQQIEKYPLSCAVDLVYPRLTELGIRKAIINHGRFLVLYFIEGQQVVLITVERAERDYITTFEANLKLYCKTDN